MIEDTKLSSLESAEEILHVEVEHSHFPHYIPVIVAGLLLVVGFVFYVVSLNVEPQVAGASTEYSNVQGK